MQNKLDKRLNEGVNKNHASGVGKLLLVVRVRGVTDISKQQKIILNKFGLRRINTAVFVRGTTANIRQLSRV